MTALLHWIGAPIYQQTSLWLKIFTLGAQSVARLFRPDCWRKDEILQALVSQGVGSLPIVVISTAFAGIVITNEIAWHMDTALHTVSMIPGFTGQFILRELGIAIPALLLVSKVGAATTAEIGSMKVTEQIDALKLLGIDPINYLVFPRFVASMISGACLTLIAIAVTLGCATAMAILRYHFSALEYLNSLRHFVGIKDVFYALIKGTVFGAVIPIIACGYGLESKGGAEGVGTATTNSVVSATIAVILLDFVLTYLFTSAL
jgi:phospholipid/cholesterol/gamma-HCH transport system permease protein